MPFRRPARWHTRCLSLPPCDASPPVIATSRLCDAAISAEVIARWFEKDIQAFGYGFERPGMTLQVRCLRNS